MTILQLRKLRHSMNKYGMKWFLTGWWWWQRRDQGGFMEKVVFKWGLEGPMGLANVKMLEKGIQGRENRKILFGKLRHQAAPRMAWNYLFSTSLFRWNSVQKALSTLGSTSQTLNTGAFLCAKSFIWGPWNCFCIAMAPRWQRDLERRQPLWDTPL